MKRPEEPDSSRIAIVGASARAAAASALRAGFTPWCADLFGDADVAAACQVMICAHYPHDLPKLILDAPPSPWMYTGAVENYPEAVTRIAKNRPLWGVDAPTLERVRDPWQVAEALRRHGLPFPELAPDADRLPADGTWLVKRFRSAGGLHVSRWIGATEPHDSSTRYFQRFIAGLDGSAVFVGAAGKARLLGVTRQLIGEPWTGAKGFRYAGSIGPMLLPATCRDQLAAIGDALCAEFRLTGLFGVDFVLAGAQVWPIEINPRYTASVEVLERATGLRSIHWHAAACRDGWLPTVQDISQISGRVQGKLILFASELLDVAPSITKALLDRNDGRNWPVVADIPQPGSRIEPNWPICTVFAEGSTDADVVENLRSRAMEISRVLAISTPALR
ncbi:MAG: ATP-grasp domain-containing protein [Planctomycetia bacterium]|nr:ATP-grasp domain-containing protein [Planctomycetia bacterium]